MNAQIFSFIFIKSHSIGIKQPSSKAIIRLSAKKKKKEKKFLLLPASQQFRRFQYRIENRGGTMYLYCWDSDTE